MALNDSKALNSIELVDDVSWKQTEQGPRLGDPNRLDPGLRAVLAWIDRAYWDQLVQRTGVRWDPAQPNLPQYLPLLVEYSWQDIRTAAVARDWLRGVNLEVADAFFPDTNEDPLPQYTTARIAVRGDDPGWLYDGSGEKKKLLRTQITEILNHKKGYVVRLELPGAAQPFNADALADIELTPANRRHPNFQPTLDGFGVVVGIIDDGCAPAHPNFIGLDAAGAPKSRILYLWDQGRSSAAGGWSSVFGYLTGGFELQKQDIDNAFGQPGVVINGVVDEEKVNGFLNHPITELASHGTQVMDIAAGNGRAPTSTEGVAPSADIIFVQLPTASIASGGATLDAAIVEGVHYIFHRAANKPVVINISFGGYSGPHDGSSIVERVIDAELATKPNRAVVVAAGNGFEADCHACGTLPDKRKRSRTLGWVVKPEDPTENILEVWYNTDADLELTLTTPAGQKLGPATLGTGPQFLISNGRLLGTLDHQQAVSPGLNRIKIILNPTGSLGSPSSTPLAPSGTWQVRLKVAKGKLQYDAWIERDMAGGPGGARRMQSHFLPQDAETLGTLASYAAGKLSISVGAYNTATQQVTRYSACGPTRDGRPKPEVLAPAEEDAAGRGILCASSRSALPTRMNGTSASAPQVAGLVALLLQAAAAKGQSLTAAQIQQAVSNGARNAQNPLKPLRPNGHVGADRRRRVKQDDPAVWPRLIGHGKLNWPQTLKLV